MKTLDQIIQHTKENYPEWNEWMEDPIMGVRELCNCYLYDTEITLGLQKLVIFDHGSLNYIPSSCTEDMLLIETAELYKSIAALEAPEEKIHFYPPNTCCDNDIEQFCAFFQYLPTSIEHINRRYHTTFTEFLQKVIPVL